MSVPSRATLLVLRRLKGADGRSLLKEAVKELITRDVLLVETEEPKRRRRTAKPRLWLYEGAGPVPEDPALRVTLRHVQAAPSTVRDGRVARELAVVAKHLARDGARRAVLDAALADLTAQGLVHEERRRVLGIVPWRKVLRTPEGDDVLVRARERSRRRRAASDAGGAPFVPATDGGGSAGDRHRDDHPDLDTDLDGSLDGAFDGSFDGAFDSAFDQSFDSAFDAGFSDGGGGGGDGGGGGGDGGGGGS